MRADGLASTAAGMGATLHMGRVWLICYKLCALCRCIAYDSMTSGTMAMARQFAKRCWHLNAEFSNTMSLYFYPSSRLCVLLEACRPEGLHQLLLFLASADFCTVMAYGVEVFFSPCAEHLYGSTVVSATKCDVM